MNELTGGQGAKGQAPRATRQETNKQEEMSKGQEGIGGGKEQAAKSNREGAKKRLLYDEPQRTIHHTETPEKWHHIETPETAHHTEAAKTMHRTAP
jgi:hypothetical protein